MSIIVKCLHLNSSYVNHCEVLASKATSILTLAWVCTFFCMCFIGKVESYIVRCRLDHAISTSSLLHHKKIDVLWSSILVCSYTALANSFRQWQHYSLKLTVGIYLVSSLSTMLYWNNGNDTCGSNLLSGVVVLALATSDWSNTFFFRGQLVWSRCWFARGLFHSVCQQDNPHPPKGGRDLWYVVWIIP